MMTKGSNEITRIAEIAINTIKAQTIELATVNLKRIIKHYLKWNTQFQFYFFTSISHTLLEVPSYQSTERSESTGQDRWSYGMAVTSDLVFSQGDNTTM